jgi:hypothetical protein
MGLFLTGLGTLAMVFGTIEYGYRLQELRRHRYFSIWRPSLIISLAMSAIGLFLSSPSSSRRCDRSRALTAAAGPYSLSVDAFSLLGGPLHRLGRRLGLVRGSNTVALGLALGGSLWLVLLLLTLIEGLGDRIFSPAALGVHVRLLVALPLFFVGETWLLPCLATFLETIVRAQVVPAGEVPRLQAELAWMRRLADTWLPDLLLPARRTGDAARRLAPAPARRDIGPRS